MYIKGLVNTKDQSNACMCEMMLKGLKEALTLLIVTHATHVKGSKEALTILIVTHVTHVKRVERLHYVHNIDTFNAMSKGLKDYVMLKQRVKHIFSHNFLNIPLISNSQKVLESWDLDLSNHTIQCYVCQSMLKGSKVKITFDPFNIHSIGWYGWKGLSLSFPKLFVD